jgi:hypothetical protein
MIHFKILLLVDSIPGYKRALLKMYNEVMNDVCMTPHIASIFIPQDQEIHFCKAMADTDDPSDGSGQSKLKTFLSGFSILDAIKSIRDSWEKVEILTIAGVWEELILTLG